MFDLIEEFVAIEADDVATDHRRRGRRPGSHPLAPAGRRSDPAIITEAVVIALRLLEIEATRRTRTCDLGRAHTVATGDNPG